MSRPLTQADKVAAFKAATASFARHIEERGPTALTDVQLESDLRQSMGVYAGCCGPDQMHITWQGAGLRIWASWEIHNPYQASPLFKGAATVAMAREVYGIANPSDVQLPLF